MGRSRACVLILTYHRVTPLEALDPFDLIVSPGNFQEHMAHLARCCEVISLTELVARLAEGQLGKGRRVAITFDDGYRDVFQFAGPVLKEYRLPATIYLASGYTGGDRFFWWDELVHVVTKDTTRVPGLCRLLGLDPRPSDEEDRKALMERICCRIRELSVEEREDILGTISPEGRPSAGERDRPMSWEEVRMMMEDGVTFGAHTCRHPALSSLSEAEALREVEGSKRAVEERLGMEISHFSYPHDDRDFHQNRLSDISRRCAVSAGFTSGVTIIPGVNRPGQDVMALRRVTVRDWTMEAFTRCLESAFEG